MDFYINISRLHPLIVHFPIGVLYLSFLMECYQRFRKTNQLGAGIDFALYIGAGSSVIAALTGWWLANEGGYNDSLLFYHRWLGIATMIGSLMVIGLRKINKANWSFGIFSAVILLMSAAGHYGGAMTHGEDYLFTNPAEVVPVVIEDINTASVYADFVAPVLKEKCFSCHNNSRTKGGLNMTSRDQLLKGGKNGSVVNVSIPAESELLQRIHLPLSDKFHMPPRGKKQFEKDDIALLTWWISNQACYDCIVEETDNQLMIRPVLERYQKAALAANTLQLPLLNTEQIAKGQSLGIVIAPLAKGNNGIIINLSGRKDLNNKIYTYLEELGGNIIELNLSNTNFSDKDIDLFHGLPVLKKLQLQQTDISDRGLESIAELPVLESLNLYGTQVSNDGIIHFEKLKKLRSLYIWQTKVDDEGVRLLIEKCPQLQVYQGASEDIFGISQLNPPLLETTERIFSDSLLINFKSNFRNTGIYYTLDGTSPDSNGIVYRNPFPIFKTTAVKAFVKKDGWEDSKVITVEFHKSKVAIAEAAYKQTPAKNYSANGPATLFDLEKGSKRFTEGTWLGFEATDVDLKFTLEKSDTIREVIVSSLASPGSWIFYPRGFTISVSSDDKNYRQVKQIKRPAPEIFQGTHLNFEKIGLDPIAAKFIKIKIKGQIKNPSWHPSPGDKSWLFIDEVMIN